MTTHNLYSIVLRVFHLIVLLFIFNTTTSTAQNTDWIPVDSIPSSYATALRTSAVQLSSTDPVIQLQTLQYLEEEISSYDQETARAAVPLLADVARREHRILTRYGGTYVPLETRIAALRILGTLGGAEARNQLHDSLRNDSDDSVRSYTALLIAASPDVSDSDLQAITDALSSAIALRIRENEIFNYLLAVEQIMANPWIQLPGELGHNIVSIAIGPYSSRTRSKASRLLELLMDR